MVTEQESQFVVRLRIARQQAALLPAREEYPHQIDTIERLAARADAGAVATLVDLLREYVHAEEANNQRAADLARIVLAGVESAADIKRIDLEAVAAERAELRKVQEESPAELTRLVWLALASMGPARSPAIRDAFEREEDPSVRWWLMNTLADIADPALRDFYLEHQAEDPGAARALRSIDSASDEQRERPHSEGPPDTTPERPNT